MQSTLPKRNYGNAPNNLAQPEVGKASCSGKNPESLRLEDPCHIKYQAIPLPTCTKTGLI